jgi:signal transduction histidine kinase
MQGMIILSIIATLLLILTLIYLLMTLFRAKSLERIRRDLTHNITHELRTPIAAARAATDTLRCTPEIAQSEALRKEYLEMTSAELERLSLLVDSILRSSLDDESPVTLRPESVELQSTINEVVASLRLKYSSRNIEFHSDISESTRLWIDRATLRTILLNIIDNSIKYSDGVPHIKATPTRHNTSIELSIEDHGIGIEPHEQRRVFDKFYRVSTAYRQNSQGYGLGLYHVRSLVERSGGKIELHSTLGQGTCITITLPTDDQTNNSRR